MHWHDHDNQQTCTGVDFVIPLSVLDHVFWSILYLNYKVSSSRKVESDPGQWFLQSPFMPNKYFLTDAGALSIGLSLCFHEILIHVGAQN